MNGQRKDETQDAAALAAAEARDRIAQEFAVKVRRVHRRCPKCLTWGYHRANHGGRKHVIQCSGCGYVWKGRVRAEENRDET